MRILVVATKAPWPAVDGGRLLLLRTLEGLAAAGVAVTLAAPIDPRRQDPAAVAAALGGLCEPELVAVPPAGGGWRWMARAAVRGLPLSIARHTVPALRRRVGELLAGGRFDLVHAEQLQALAQALGPARRHGVPIVLRAQNVESALWAAAAASAAGAAGRGAFLGFEARRLAAWEGRAVAAVDATAALTAIDSAALRDLAGVAGAGAAGAGAGAAGGAGRTGGARVVEVAAPFAAELPPGARALPGDPAVVVLGSSGWRPNEDAVRWFAGDVWPAVQAALPAARLHVFGIPAPAGGGAIAAGVFGGSDTTGVAGTVDAPGAASASSAAAGAGVAWHGAPEESATAFAPGSVHVVPLRFGSGVRMKILEAWARGIPVVSTPEGAAGLAARDGNELLVARDAPTFTAALGRLRSDPTLRAALVAAGRSALRQRHDPAETTRSLIAVYEEVLAER